MRPTIEQLRYLTDFGPNYRWDANFVLPAQVAAAISSADFNIRATSMTIPKRTVDVIEIANRGHKIFREGITNFSQTITISTIATVDAMVHKACRNWGQMQWSDNIGAMSTTVAKDRQGTVTLRALNNADVGYWQYTIIGAWLQDIDFGEYGSDSSDIIRPSLTIQYDYYVDGPTV